MMKKITLILLLISSSFLSAQVGSLDVDFGDNGKVITSINGNEKGYGIAMQSDAKIVIAGYSNDPTFGENFICIRYNTDGSLDTSFGNGGIVSTDVQLGSDDRAKSVVIQNDGKIILAGHSDNGSDRDAAIVRYNTDGSLDTSFGNGGIVLTDFENNQQDLVNRVRIHNLTGNIIIGGETVINSTTSKPVLARYTSNGSLDTSFNSTGIRLLWITSLDYQYKFSLEDFQVKTNGKITAIGWRDFINLSWSSDYWACQVNTNGTMDTTFSTDGVNTYNGSFNGHDRAFSMLFRNNGNILLSGAGYVDDLQYDVTAFELTSSGGVATPYTRIEYNTQIIPQDFCYGMAEDSNNEYILVGSSGNTSNKSITLSRLNSDLSLDTDFGTSGKVINNFDSNSLNEAFDVTIQADGKIVLVGYTGNNIVVARYETEDSLSVEEFANTSVSVYPNPTRDFLNISLNNYSYNKGTIVLYSTVGSKILEQKIDSQKVSLEELKTGMYVYELFLDNKLVKRGKVIKQ
ncbi:T9SS type A sorting domain-containing protein [uncultured Kordia sp.]|uniref:T9SS type A sorting domain-containing protein n=1 Tax=uncultured Kordia sp. TaxID=507699 RepID=UPI00260D7562|nr:T9SS type A sorting domain-containing protein [uncultured Kordia sp.]